MAIVPSDRDDPPLWGFTWLSALVLAVAALCFLQVYEPRRERADRLDEAVAAPRRRLEPLRESGDRLVQRVEALEREDPETVRDAIREQLLKAPPGEWLPPLIDP